MEAPSGARSFDRLGIADSEHHARRALARYGRDIVVEAIAIFDGKQSAGTLPDDVDAARYILGIARNITHVHEAHEVTLALIRDRLAVRDALLASLRQECDQLLERNQAPKTTLYALVDHALRAERMIDQLFWIDATAEFMKTEPAHLHPTLFRDLARRIHATSALQPRERTKIERRLALLIRPIS